MVNVTKGPRHLFLPLPAARRQKFLKDIAVTLPYDKGR